MANPPPHTHTHTHTLYLIDTFIYSKSLNIGLQCNNVVDFLPVDVEIV